MEKIGILFGLGISFDPRSKGKKGYTQDIELPASAPVGRRGAPLENYPSGGPPRNSEQEINGFTYSGHAVDNLQNRGFVPSVAENTIATGHMLPGYNGAVRHYDPVNNVTVVRDPITGMIITLY